MSDKFTTGDTVFLNSGSPMMTIGARKGEHTYVCSWFNIDHERQSTDFLEYCLVPSCGWKSYWCHESNQWILEKSDEENE